MFQLENIKGTAGALWEFDWVTAGDVPMREDVLLFAPGQQSYTIYMTGPAGPHDDSWNKGTLPTVGSMLSTSTTSVNRMDRRDCHHAPLPTIVR